MKPRTLCYRLDRWYETALGKQVSEAIQAELDNFLANLPGQHLLQLGCPKQSAWLQASPIQHQCHVVANTRQLSADLYSKYTDLPLSNDSIDVIVIPTLLEFISDPAAVLREADRVLHPDGHLVVIGFNPISLWGLRRALPIHRGELPWAGKFLGQRKIRRLLLSKGYRLKHVNGCFYRPPLQNLKLLDKLLFLENLGKLAWPYPAGLYLLVWQKQVIQVTPIKPLWRFRNIVVGKAFIQPTS